MLGEEFPTNSRPMLSRALLHNTVRIEAAKAGGVATGTGFFYTFINPTKTSSIPVVVTCWHVVSDSTHARMYFALASSNRLSRVQDHFTINLPPNLWIRHPDTNIDLAVMPIAPLMRQLGNEGKWLDFAPMAEDLIPKEAELPKYGVFQEVKFIGYPIGIWDEKNNLPIVRRGMTATDPVVDYNGRKEFLVDAAVFPGSSGSPVYIANEGINFFDGGISTGSRIKFLGVLYAVHQYSFDGNVEMVTIPTAFDVKVRNRIPANLGLVIKAACLNDFKLVFDELEKKQDLARQAEEKKAALSKGK